MTAAAPHVTAAILNYDGRDLLKVVVPSVLSQSLQAVRVIVIDDGSRDDSVTLCREGWPQIEVVELGRNMGVAAALNRAVEAADGSEYLALLNNDLELDSQWLARLVRTLDEHPEAGSATGKTFNYFRRDELDGAGDLLMPSGAATRRGLGERDRGQYARAEAVFSSCAGMAVYRMRAFAEVGGFDEDFVAYQEDIDWGFRAQLAGFTARYEPAAVAWHMCGATTDRQWARFNDLQRRNQVLVVIKCYPAELLCKHLLAILSYQAGWLLDAVRHREFARQIRALGGVARQLRGTLSKRRRIQARRRVSSSYIDGILTAPAHSGETVGEHIRRVLG